MNGVGYIAIKRDNMIKGEVKRLSYRILSRVRRIIETHFYQLEKLGLRFMSAVSKRGLAVKVILAILAFNIYYTWKGI